SALVATAHEHEELTASARQALDWLSQQGAPVIEASHAERRAHFGVYVPGNEERVLRGWEAAEQKLADARDSQAALETAADAKTARSARNAASAAEKKLAENMNRAVQDDGKG